MDARNKKTANKLKSIASSLALGALLLCSTVTHATVDIGNSPLFISGAVQPNVFVMLDDSGSMNDHCISRPGAGNCSFLNPVAAASGISDNRHGGTFVTSPLTNSTRRQSLCNGYNALAYDPTITYTPWHGVDAAGNPFRDAHLMEPGGFTEIRMNPYCPNGNTSGASLGDGTNALMNCNMGGHYAGDLANLSTSVETYYVWTDSNSNGEYDSGECNATSSGNNKTFASLTPAEQINYANWYSYYRTRDLAMKAAVTEFIFNNHSRIGFSTLANNKNVGIPVRDANTANNPTAAAQAYKDKILEHIATSHPTGGVGTPLRRALDLMGRYYSDDLHVYSPGGSNIRLFDSTPASDPDSAGPNRMTPILNRAKGGECQSNYAILFTDGEYNGSNATSIGNEDGDNNTAWDGSPYGDTVSDSLADIAMKYYETDLHTGLADNIPPIGVDNAPHQHMTTFTVTFGLTGTLDPFDTMTPGDATDTDPNDAGFAWPTTLSGATKTDDVWHAAYNGRGQYLSASSSQELKDAFQKINDAVKTAAGSASAVAVSAGSITNNTNVYQANYISGSWLGHLRAKVFSGLTITDTNVWGGPPSEAGSIINQQNWNTGRHIITWDADTPGGVAFRWGNLGATHQASLRDGDTVTKGQERLEFLRGDHSNEKRNGGTLRNRFHTYDENIPQLGITAGMTEEFVLGDIVHSSPLYVGSPNFGYSNSLESVPYDDFRVLHHERKPMIYVGANDGMLHAIDANTGEERLAYVPSAVYHNLASLTDLNYTHNYYVDESPVAGDVLFTPSGGTTAEWHTVLVGSLRAGGKAVFALDITDPVNYTDSEGNGHSYRANFDEANADNIVLWEFKHPELGFSFGKPVIARMANGKWAAIFGNGYNSSVPLPGDTSACGTSYSCSGTAQLFIVDIADGSIIARIDTGVGTAAFPNGLNAPSVVDDNGDSIADLIYAGDLRGNLWKIDVSNTNAGQWGIKKKSGATPLPLFVATDSGGARQPITSAPEITAAPDQNDGLMIYFGTGKFLGKTDVTNISPSALVQSMYGVWDETGTGTENNNTVVRSYLQNQTITQYDDTGANADNPNHENAEFRTTSSTSITAWGIPGPSPATSGNRMGWVIDFNPATTGFPAEGVIYKPLAFAGNIIFSTLIPREEGCGASAIGWVMAVNGDSGGPPEETFFDTNDDYIVALDDNVPCTGINCGGRLTKDGAPTQQIPMLDNSAPPGGGGGGPQPRSCDSMTGALVGGNSSGGNATARRTNIPANLCRQSWREL